MMNVDEIICLLDWNKSLDEQAEGIKMAKQVENINVFLQPCPKNYNKNVWDNCAKVLSERTDKELSPYLVELLEWLQDLNWPGAFCIFDRLQKYADEASYNQALNTCFKYVQATQDDIWAYNLRMLEAQRVKRQ